MAPLPALTLSWGGVRCFSDLNLSCSKPFWSTHQHSPLSWPMADWFMEECMMLSDWTLGGRGGIWLPAGQPTTQGLEKGFKYLQTFENQIVLVIVSLYLSLNLWNVNQQVTISESDPNKKISWCCLLTCSPQWAVGVIVTLVSLTSSSLDVYLALFWEKILPSCKLLHDLQMWYVVLVSEQVLS